MYAIKERHRKGMQGLSKERREVGQRMEKRVMGQIRVVQW